MVVERKPVPFTVSVSCPEPAVTLVGLIEVTVGAVGWVFPPEPDEEPLPPAPQPVRKADTRMEAEAREKLDDFIASEYNLAPLTHELKMIDYREKRRLQ